MVECFPLLRVLCLWYQAGVPANLLLDLVVFSTDATEAYQAWAQALEAHSAFLKEKCVCVCVPTKTRMHLLYVHCAIQKNHLSP